MEENIIKGNEKEEPLINIKDKGHLPRKSIIIIIISIILALCFILIIILAILLQDDEKGTTPIYINPVSNYTHCIIWLHGLDNKPENFINLFTKEIKIPYKDNTKIILMRAPKVKVTNISKRLTSWFDIYSFPINSKDSYNFEDAKNSSNILLNIIKEEAKILGGHYEKILIGGHSQGACVSLYTGYSFEKLLGGVIACSGVLFPQGEIIGNKQKLNVYLGHGDKDEVIPLEFHKESIKRIEDYEGIKKYYYEGHGHSISNQEKKDIEIFLNEIMI